MQTEVVTTPDRLIELGPAWERLWQRAAPGVVQGIFQTHGWITAWWSAQPPGAGFRLQLGLCWDAGELAAIIPCVTRPHRGLRVLEWAAKDCSDYCDALARPGAPHALAAAWQAIVDARGFHAVYLSHVRPGAALAPLLQPGRPSPATLRLGQRSGQTLQVRSNGLTGAGWFRTLSKKARNNHLRGQRILEESGRLSIGVVDDDDIDAALDRMIALKRAWLESTGQRSAVLAQDASGLRALLEFLRRRQALQLFRVACDGELVSGLVNIIGGHRTAAFFSAFDPRFDRASPGTIALVETVRRAFDQGIPEVDFLCGDEPYKFKFANARTDLASYVGARTLLGQAALAAGEWLDKARPKTLAPQPSPA